MRKLLTVSLMLAFFYGFSQTTEKLNDISKQYFTQIQIDTMSQNFIAVQNYIAINSWEIYLQGDKTLTPVGINKDTIDIRKFLVARKEYKSVFVNNVYEDYMIEFYSKDVVKDRIIYIYKN